MFLIDVFKKPVRKALLLFDPNSEHPFCQTAAGERERERQHCTWRTCLSISASCCIFWPSASDRRSCRSISSFWTIRRARCSSARFTTSCSCPCCFRRASTCKNAAVSQQAASVLRKMGGYFKQRPGGFQEQDKNSL